jgi:RimJ/RimL family protein N-acetyltransferase
MAGLISKAQELARFARDGHSKLVLQAVLGRLYRNGSSVGFRRDLSKAFQVPSANLQIVVRPLRPDDDLAFLHGGGEEDSWTRFAQLRMVKANLHTCYVAVASNGDICYMQWLIPATENEEIQATFGSQFPLLNADEALLEGAYTVPAYRGRRIMASAMAQIAEKAEQLGAHWVITFVASDNEPSLKGCARAGFEPYLLRHESWRMLHRSINFVPISRPADSQVLA